MLIGSVSDLLEVSDVVAWLAAYVMFGVTSCAMSVTHSARAKCGVLRHFDNCAQLYTQDDRSLR